MSLIWKNALIYFYQYLRNVANFILLTFTFQKPYMLSYANFLPFGSAWEVQHIAQPTILSASRPKHVWMCVHIRPENKCYQLMQNRLLLGCSVNPGAVKHRKRFSHTENDKKILILAISSHPTKKNLLGGFFAHTKKTISAFNTTPMPLMSP